MVVDISCAPKLSIRSMGRIASDEARQRGPFVFQERLMPLYRSSTTLLASPILTGSPTAPTPSAGDNDTSVATTAFIHTEAARGALVTKASDQTTANYSAGAAIAWDTESYDTDAIHDNVTNNSRLTVPVGVTKVRLSFNILMSLVTANTDTQVTVKKNGADGYAGVAATADSSAGTSPRWSGETAILTVVAGDYFELHLACGDTSITVAATYSWFAMEIVA